MNGTSASAINGKMEETKEKPLNELLTSRIVDIYVGPENTHWPLHEKLLCHYSSVLADKFYNEDTPARGNNKSFGLPEEEDCTFEMLVSWLYSRRLDPPAEEKEIGPLLDLYLLSEKLEMEKLSNDIVEVVRQFYHEENAYPGLRRVQYIYSNTDEDNSMREMMVSSIARYLALGDSIPAHWNKALKNNGDLAVDIIRAIQEWHLEGKSVPDARDGSADRGRTTFSKIEPEQDYGSSQPGTPGIKSYTDQETVDE